MGDNSDFSQILVEFYNEARTHFQENAWNQAPPPSAGKPVLAPPEKPFTYFEIPPAEIFGIWKGCFLGQQIHWGVG